MALGDTYRLTRRVLINGQQHHNVLHFSDTNTVPPAQGEEQALLDAWIGNPALPVGNEPEVELKGIQRGAVTRQVLGISAQRILPTVGFAVETTNTGPFAVVVDTGLPSMAQTSVLFQSDIGGRSGRGRMLISGIPEAYTTGNFSGASLDSDVDDFIDALIRVFTASGAGFAGFVLGVFSRLLIEIHPVVSFGHQAAIGTIVSRREGRGV